MTSRGRYYRHGIARSREIRIGYLYAEDTHARRIIHTIPLSLRDRRIWDRLFAMQPYHPFRLPAGLRATANRRRTAEINPP